MSRRFRSYYCYLPDPRMDINIKGSHNLIATARLANVAGYEDVQDRIYGIRDG